MENFCCGNGGSCYNCLLRRRSLTALMVESLLGPAADGTAVATSTSSSPFGDPASVVGAPSSSTVAVIEEGRSDTSVPYSPSSSETDTSMPDSSSPSETDTPTPDSSSSSETDTSTPDSSSSSDSGTWLSDSEEEEEGDIVVQPSQEDVPLNSSTPNRNAAIMGPTGDRSAGLLLTLKDPAVLKCPICTLPLSLPIYQCEHGHIACASCCLKWNKCSFCQSEIGFSRCRAIENVIESIRSSCCYMQYGCMAMFSYDKRRDHEKVCSFEPCCCPYTDCKYKGMCKELYEHFELQHQSLEFLFSSTFCIRLHKDDEDAFFQERNEKTLFVLENIHFSKGNLVILYCVAPSSVKCVFKYEVSTTCGSVQRIAFARKTQDQIINIPHRKFIFIPKDYITCDFLSLKITIWKQPGVQVAGSSERG